MTLTNSVSEPEEDYSSWVASVESSVVPNDTNTTTLALSKRWCPTHRTYEVNPSGRLMCGPAWKELYQMEREVEVENMSPNLAILTLAGQLGELITEMRYSGIVADPPPRPKPESPRPPTAPSPAYPRQRGKGGVALP